MVGVVTLVQVVSVFGAFFFLLFYLHRMLHRILTKPARFLTQIQTFGRQLLPRFKFCGGMHLHQLPVFAKNGATKLLWQVVVKFIRLLAPGLGHYRRAGTRLVEALERTILLRDYRRRLFALLLVYPVGLARDSVGRTEIPVLPRLALLKHDRALLVPVLRRRLLHRVVFILLLLLVAAIYPLALFKNLQLVLRGAIFQVLVKLVLLRVLLEEATILPRLVDLGALRSLRNSLLSQPWRPLAAIFACELLHTQLARLATIIILVY